MRLRTSVFQKSSIAQKWQRLWNNGDEILPTLQYLMCRGLEKHVISFDREGTWVNGIEKILDKYEIEDTTDEDLKSMWNLRSF